MSRLRAPPAEFVASEALHYLGVPTTRALSLVGTGAEVVRDMFYCPVACPLAVPHPLRLAAQAQPTAVPCSVLLMLAGTAHAQLCMYGAWRQISYAGQEQVCEFLTPGQLWTSSGNVMSARHGGLPRRWHMCLKAPAGVPGGP